MSINLDKEFCIIGVDQALEQGNITVKVMGGLKGITQRPSTLTRYFVAAPELAHLALEADKMTHFSQKKWSHNHKQSNTITTRQEVAIRNLHNEFAITNPLYI